MDSVIVRSTSMAKPASAALVTVPVVLTLDLIQVYALGTLA